MSFARYPLYRDSGIGWLGEVPAHWDVQRLRMIAALNPSKGELRAWDRDTPVSFLPMEAIGEDGSLELSRERPLAELEGGYSYFRNGDVVVAKITPCFENGKGAVMRGLRGGIGFGTTELIVVRPDPARTSSSFLHYLFTSRQFRDLGESYMYGAGGQRRVPDDFVRNFVVPLPPREEQDALVAFLDEETAKLDTLVDEQQRLIDLLREKRQAVIDLAVRSGIVQGRREEPSNLDWLGPIPSDWKMQRLKYLSPAITVGIVVDPSSYVADEGVPFLYGGDIREGAVDWQSARRISPENSATNAKTRLQAGDLVCVRVGAPGVTAVVPPECQGGNCASVMLVRRGEFNSAWLCYVMNSRVIRYQVEVVQYGAAQEQFNIGHAVNFWIPVPPRAEQDRIADHLAHLSERLLSLIIDAERAIILLQERRSALISSAVTGRIDIRTYRPAEELVPA